MITNNGYSTIASQIATLFTHGEVGSGNTTPQPTDTTLETPISGTLKALDSSQSNNKVITTIYTLDTATGNGSTIKEFGLENVGTTTTLISRYIFPSINKTSNLELTIKNEFLVE